MTIEVTCNLRHCRIAGYCLPSIKEYCIKHGVDWRVFKKGISSKVLEEYNLTEFNNVIAVARAQNGV